MKFNRNTVEDYINHLVKDMKVPRKFIVLYNLNPTTVSEKNENSNALESLWATKILLDETFKKI